MNVLFINAAFRDGSRTLRLAEYYLQKHHAGDAVTRLELGENPPAPLDAPRLREYNAAVESRGFSGEMFDCARQFAQADVILIAAPFWNFGLPAVLSAYLELVCSQGVSFDILAEKAGVLHHRRRIYSRAQLRFRLHPAALRGVFRHIRRALLQRRGPGHCRHGRGSRPGADLQKHGLRRIEIKYRIAPDSGTNSQKSLTFSRKEYLTRLLCSSIISMIIAISH